MKHINQVNELLTAGVTYEELKKFKGFESLTEAEAEKELETINRLAKVLYYLYANEQQTNRID